MFCEICKKDIKDNYYVEVTAKVIKTSNEHVGSLIFTKKEKDYLSMSLYVHKQCWFDVMGLKEGKKLEVK